MTTTAGRRTMGRAERAAFAWLMATAGACGTAHVDDAGTTDAATPVPDVVVARDAGGDTAAGAMLFAHCATASVCGRGLSCDTSFPGGLCTKGCSRDAQCGDGVCDDSTGTGQCVPSCGSGGLECDPYGGACDSITRTGGDPVFGCHAVCFASGAANAPDNTPACIAGTSCNVDQAACVTTGSDPAGAGSVGDPCVMPTECKSGLCIPEVNNDQPTGFPGGSCISFGRGPASATDRIANCPAGAAFVPLSGLGGQGDLGYCFRDCAGDAACRPGYRCLKGSGQARGTCRPINCAARGQTCTPGTSCHTATRTDGTMIGACLTEGDAGAGDASASTTDATTSNPGDATTTPTDAARPGDGGNPDGPSDTVTPGEAGTPGDAATTGTDAAVGPDAVM